LSLAVPLALLLTAGTLAVAACGCWDSKEIEDLAIVVAGGFDWVPESGQYQITAQVAKLAAPAGGTAGAADERGFWLASARGYTLSQTERQLMYLSPRQFFWPHNQAAVFGEGLARKGVVDVVSILCREGQTKRSTPLFVARGATAEELLQAEYELAQVPAVGLRDQSIRLNRRTSQVPVVSLHEFLVEMESEGIDPILPAVETIDKPQPGALAGDMERDEIRSSPRMAGAAVFRGDRLVGYLDPYSTRAVLIVRGQAQTGTFNVPVQQGEHKYAALEQVAFRTQTTPELRDGRPALTVNIRMEVGLGELQAHEDPLLPAVADRLERRLTEAVRQEVEAAVARAVALEADVFGFGRMFARYYPQEWASLKHDWRERLGQVPVDVVVEVELKRTRMIGIRPRPR